MARTYYTANTTSFQDFVFESSLFSFLNEPFESLPFNPLFDSPATTLPLYKGLFFNGMYNEEPFFKKPHVYTYEFGVQTDPIAIPRIPESIFSHPQKRLRLTNKPSPLTLPNNTAQNTYKTKKRKLKEISAYRDCTWPPKKRPACEDQDQEYDTMNYLDYYISSDEEDVAEFSCDEDVAEFPCDEEDEGIAKVSVSNIGVRSLGTNTVHIPVW